MPLRRTQPLACETGHRVVNRVVIGSHQRLSKVYLCSWVFAHLLTRHQKVFSDNDHYLAINGDLNAEFSCTRSLGVEEWVSLAWIKVFRLAFK